MRRVLFEIPGLGYKLSGFGALMLAACVAALWVTARRARREGLSTDTVFELAVWLMSGGFIGARLLYIVAHPDSVHGLLDVFRIWQGGIVFYGCIIGGLIGSLIYWYRHPFPFRAMADAVAPALAIGSAFGRIGCWLNGCCFGGVSDLPWAVRFPPGSPPWGSQVRDGLIAATDLQTLPVHPTQLYSAFDGFLVLALLSAYFPLRRRDGEVMALLMVTYPVTRFLTEGLRRDEPALFEGLTMSQWISVVVFAAGLGVWLYLRTLPPGRFADRARAGLPSHREPAGSDSPFIKSERLFKDDPSRISVS